MPGSVRGYFKDFVDTQEGFQIFHNQIILSIESFILTKGTPKSFSPEAFL